MKYANHTEKMYKLYITVKAIAEPNQFFINQLKRLT